MRSNKNSLRKTGQDMKWSIIISAVAVAALLPGCKSVQPAIVPEGLPVPATFAQADTTGNMGLLSWKSFYKDEKLIELVELALKNNPDIRSGLHRIVRTKAQAYMARAEGLPTLNLVATAAADKYGDYTMNGVGNFDTNLSDNIDNDQKVTDPALDLFLGLRSNWEVDIWGKLKAKRKAAYDQYLASEQTRRWFVTQVVAQVAERYYDLLALDKKAAIVNRNIALQEKAVEISSVQMDGGRATSLAVKQFQAQLLNSRSAALQIRQQIQATENELNVLLGRFPETIVRSKAILSEPLPEQLSAGIPATVLHQRPDIAAAELNLRAAKADVKAAQKAFFPSLTLTPYTGFNAFKGPLLFAPGSFVYGLLGGISTPIFNQRQLRGQFAITNAAQFSAFYDYQKSVLNAYNEVVTELQHLQNNEVAYQLKAAEVDTLNSAVAAANDLYVGGYANYLEVITAQRSVLEAELEQVTLKKNLLLSTTRLYRALGGGWN